MADEATAEVRVEHGTWLRLQPSLDDEDALPFPVGSDPRKKQLLMTAGADTAHRLAKE